MFGHFRNHIYLRVAVAAVGFGLLGAPTSQAQAAGGFCEIDTDGDLSWSFEEYRGHYMPDEIEWTEDLAEAYINYLQKEYDQLDQNSDDAIGFSEYRVDLNRRTVEKFEIIDANQDGAIVLDELVGLKGEGRRYADSLIFAGNFLSGNYKGEDGPLVEGGDDDTPYDERQAARLGQAFALADRDRDGKLLLADELAGPETVADSLCD